MCTACNWDPEAILDQRKAAYDAGQQPGGTLKPVCVWDACMALCQYRETADEHWKAVVADRMRAAAAVDRPVSPVEYPT